MEDRIGKPTRGTTPLECCSCVYIKGRGWECTHWWGVWRKEREVRAFIYHTVAMTTPPLLLLSSYVEEKKIRTRTKGSNTYTHTHTTGELEDGYMKNEIIIIFFFEIKNKNRDW